MEIKVLQAQDQSLIAQIKESLAWAHTAHWGVAYASHYAYNVFKSELEAFLRRNGKIRVLFDIEKLITDQQIITAFMQLAGDSECKIFLKPKGISNRASYHPKFYLFYDNDRYNVIIGSSNFTMGGIQNNYETNLSIVGKKDDFFDTLKNHYQALWQMDFAVNILENAELLEEYKIIKEKRTEDERKSDRKLDTLRNKISKKVIKIVDEKKKPLNENFAYLLGLVCANGKIDEEKNEVIINLDRYFANKGKEYEGFYYNPEISDYRISQEEAHERDIELISERLENLLGYYTEKNQISHKKLKDLHFQITISCVSKSELLQELQKYNLSGQFATVPNAVMKSNDMKVIKSFLRGYFDLKSRMSSSDGIYTDRNGFRYFSSLRVGISISHKNPQLMNDLVFLLKKIGIVKGMTATKPELRTREHLIRIEVRHFPVDLVGTHWRRIFLQDFQRYFEKKKSGNSLGLNFEEND